MNYESRKQATIIERVFSDNLTVWIVIPLWREVNLTLNGCVSFHRDTDVTAPLMRMHVPQNDNKRSQVQDMLSVTWHWWVTPHTQTQQQNKAKVQHVVRAGWTKTTRRGNMSIGSLLVRGKKTTELLLIRAVKPSAHNPTWRTACRVFSPLSTSSLCILRGLPLHY